MPSRRASYGHLNPTATLECIAKICPCKMAVLQGPVISVMSVGSAHNSLCYRVCSYKCRCRDKRGSYLSCMVAVPEAMLTLGYDRYTAQTAYLNPTALLENAQIIGQAK